jgi:hypothetical protein
MTEAGTRRTRFGSRRQRIAVVLIATTLGIVAINSASDNGIEFAGGPFANMPGPDTSLPTSSHLRVAREAMQPDDPTPGATLGAFAPSPEQLVSYSDWVGREVTSGLAYAPWRAGWSEWRVSIQNIVEDYRDPRWGFEPRVVLSVPMLVREPLDNEDPMTLRAGAEGRYDEQWRWLGRYLVESYGSELVDRFVLRLGHESNIQFYPWSAHPESHNGPDAPDDFAEYWRRIHGIVNGIVSDAEAGLVWDWNLSLGNQDPEPIERSYPGDEFVDVVTVDFYDSRGGFERIQQTSPMSLDGWFVPFADAHNKPIGIDEWSVSASIDGDGGGDNPAFIEAVYFWIDHQLRVGRLVWHHQFDRDGTDKPTSHRMREGGRFDFSDARAKFLELFGTG